MSPQGSKQRGGKRQGPAVQYAALPFRVRDGVEVLLVTSRGTGRWVLPKGWPMKRKTPAQAAAREAIEEAGVTGQVAAEPAGDFGYVKVMADGSGVKCRVQVFPLRVEVERARWPEMKQRRRAWFSREAAAEAVTEPELKALLTGFSPG
jgi:8-oxo-dGTP pyrophosphatase MutT (NUDIX family)